MVSPGKSPPEVGFSYVFFRALTDQGSSKYESPEKLEEELKRLKKEAVAKAHSAANKLPLASGILILKIALDVLLKGLRHLIVMFEEEILDGHTRWIVLAKRRSQLFR